MIFLPRAIKISHQTLILIFDVLNWTNTIKYGLPGTGHMILHCQCNWWKMMEEICLHPTDLLQIAVWNVLNRMLSTSQHISAPQAMQEVTISSLLRSDTQSEGRLAVLGWLQRVPTVPTLGAHLFTWKNNCLLLANSSLYLPSTVMHFAVKKIMLEEDQLCEFRLNNAFMWQRHRVLGAVYWIAPLLRHTHSYHSKAHHKPSKIGFKMNWTHFSKRSLVVVWHRINIYGFTTSHPNPITPWITSPSGPSDISKSRISTVNVGLCFAAAAGVAMGETGETETWDDQGP